MVSAHEACGQRAQSLRSVRSLHLVFHAVRQLFNLLRLLNHIDGQQAFVGLVHGLLQFVCQLEQFLGIALEISLALQVGLPGHLSFHPEARLVFRTGARSVRQTHVRVLRH